MIPRLGAVKIEPEDVEILIALSTFSPVHTLTIDQRAADSDQRVLEVKAKGLKLTAFSRWVGIVLMSTPCGRVAAI